MMEQLENPMVDIARQYVASRTNLYPVSTAEAVGLIRLIMPQSDLSDREIADLVAAAAIEAGHSVSFDLECAHDGLHAPIPLAAR
jgi:hypothetical protein